MNEQPLDLKSSFAILRRRRLAVAVVALLGLCLGLGYAVVRRPMPSAVALVVVQPAQTQSSSSGTPTLDMKTQILIATSTPVLSAASKAVTPSVPPATLREQVAVTSPSSNVLKVRVRAAQAAQATALADAVAQGYIQYVSDSSLSSAKASIAALKSQGSRLTKQVQDLQQQMNTVTARLAAEGASSPNGQSDTSLLDSLRNEQGQVALQLDSITTQIANAQSSNTAASAYLLQRAAVETPSSLVSRSIRYGLIGLGLGLVVGSTVILLKSRRDHRLRRRDEIAVAIGVPVIGSIEADGCKTVGQWSRLLDRFSPPPGSAWTLRRLLRRLVPADLEGKLTIRVISFAGDRPAITAGPQLAMFAGRLGIPAGLAPGDQESLEPLRAACTTVCGPGNSSAPFEFGADDEQGLSNAQLVVSVVAVNKSQPSLVPFVGPTILSISSGFAAADDLARVALAASEGGLGIDGILVINPDPGDSSVGLVPERKVEELVLRRAGSLPDSGSPTVGQPR